MKHEHTPGPWIHHNYKTNVEITVAAVDGKHIADVYAIAFAGNGDRLRAVTPTDKANARLIAAAPEMLEALKLALEHLRIIEGDVTPNSVFLTLKDTIAKAEGRNA